ncbi:cytochrome P450 [Nocardia sp. BMG51109]|uniref:cytochrome P450 n=1 Tax=Nocardia sp. BMG51109 TaxID=1056816 RepID=UPI0005607583|nr:cytochrome P450 [Nocardia sp. BMG51109]
MTSASPAVADIPAAPGALPMIGHGWALMRAPLRFLASLPDHGPLCRIKLGPETLVCVCDPALADDVLRNDRIYDKGGVLFERGREVVGNGLGTCPHARHRRQRRLCQPAFGKDRFPAYATTMTTEIAATVQTRWTDGQVIDLGAELSAMTFQVAITTMFSESLPPQIRSIAADLGTLNAGLFRRTALPPALNRLPTPHNRRFNDALRRVRDCAAAVITQRRTGPAHDHDDLLTALLQARDSDSDSVLTDAELIDQTLTFFMGGGETTAGTLSWALYLLDRHPHIRHQLHHEVDAVLHGRTATQHDLPHLPLARRVITETLRLYPPTWILTRHVTADTTLGHTPIPAGTTIAVSPFIAHRSPQLYDDPAEFRPDRWIHRAPKPDGRFIAFGAGARKCIGEDFAWMEATLALATITARWRLSSAGPPITLSMTQIPVPKHLRMRLTQRRPNGEDAAH